MKKCLVFFFFITFLPSLAIGADYTLKKDCYVFSSQFQIGHLENLSEDAFSGYLIDQERMGRVFFNQKEIIVTIVDSCTFCKLASVKVKTKEGKLVGWVFKHDLKKLKKK